MIFVRVRAVECRSRIWAAVGHVCAGSPFIAPCFAPQKHYIEFQAFITEPTRTFAASDLPPLAGGHTADEVVTAVRLLDRMAKAMRQRRYVNGALNLNQPKMSFSLSAETGTPIGCAAYVIKDSNRLIEEFMLLANMAVAHRWVCNFLVVAWVFFVRFARYLRSSLVKFMYGSL